MLNISWLLITDDTLRNPLLVLTNGGGFKRATGPLLRHIVLGVISCPFNRTLHAGFLGVGVLSPFKVCIDALLDVRRRLLGLLEISLATMGILGRREISWFTRGLERILGVHVRKVALMSWSHSFHIDAR